jgi:phosphoribosylaminoimidazole-succinocarboxamide synthase
MLTHADLMAALPHALESVHLDGFGQRVEGKVRDIYLQPGRRLLIATDRVSAFDRVLGLIPFRGQVLNQLSLWWFDQFDDLSDRVRNHVLESPDPNVTIAKEAKALPVEVIVRGYITGVTSTSIWTLYQQGERAPYGVSLPDGLKKNDPLPAPILTPTTKAIGGAHDERLTRDQIIAQGLVAPALWEQVEQIALSIFERGQKIAHDAGLILVDTKYEFGVIDGQLTLIDEIHTPDSSRYWTAESVRAGGEPEHFDKEYLRLWFAAQGYRGEGKPPAMPTEFAADVAGRYITAYERLTGLRFEPADQPAGPRIARSLQTYRLE